MESPSPAHRFAVALGGVAAAAGVLWQLRALAVGAGDPLAPLGLQLLALLAAAPMLALPVAAVVLAVRTGWHRTAGLVLLAVAGLLQLRGIAVVGLLPGAAGDAGVLLLLTRTAASVAAGLAAVIALRAGGDGALRDRVLGSPDGGHGGLRDGAALGSPDARGWRGAAAGAAVVLAVLGVAEIAAMASRGVGWAVPWFVLGGVLGACALALVAVAALRVADRRLLALVLVLPGAEGLAEAVAVIVQSVQLRQAAAVVDAAPGMPWAPVHALAAAVLALAAARWWTRARPLRDDAPPLQSIT